MSVRKHIKGMMLLVVMMITVMGISITTKATEHTLNIGNGNITCDKDNDIYHITGTSNRNNITVDGKNITIYLEGVNIDLSADKFMEKAAINIKDDSDVIIYLVGENKLKGGKHTGIGKNYGYAGIHVDEDGKVTILGNGKLTAIGGGGDRGAAAIGGNANVDAGKVIIGGYGYNPIIDASAPTGGAGIGAGYDADAEKGIIINSGTITATGGEGAAGIGGGRESYVKGISINGGTIVATGGKYGAGIGAGNAIRLGDGGSINGINITGGNITATGGGGAAGIGGGDESKVTGLKIEQSNDLTITATGGTYGAGIGSGNADISNISITLNGGTIKATGGKDGAGIGAGDGGFDSIEIYGSGNIKAIGLKSGCGIGSSGGSDGGSITIEGTENKQALIIDANAWWEVSSTHNNSCSAAAIGTSNAGCGNINISNARLIICSYGYGSGIGTGKKSGADFNDGMNITITNCTITDNGRGRIGAGIGAGFDSRVNNIKITDTSYRGGNIGGSNCTNNMSGKNDINSIEIRNSKIDAQVISENGGKAAIGTGPCGQINLIKIIDSDITAHSKIGAGIGSGGYADVGVVKMHGGEAKHIYISGSTIDAVGGDGGAGIGGGWGTYANKIEIHNCSLVNATGSYRGQANSNDNDEFDEYTGGAGIGGGGREGCGDIIISNSNVTAKGSYWSAAIGASGSNTASSTLWNVSCGSISISSSTVTATGGYGGAGIGTGRGTQFTSDAFIHINDSVVNSTGGGKGAGIGAGANGSGIGTNIGAGDNSYLARGGEANAITISGKSKVEANGGYGAAGIGGGYEGGAKEIYIELAETTYKDGEWLYYVKAVGGDGAAGIGSGGVYLSDNSIFPQNGQDLDKISITGGYVHAIGGDDCGLGAGAGIGGGARGGRLKGFYMSGGYVNASAGQSSRMSNEAEADIGAGGCGIRSSMKDANYVISGGTVIGRLSNEPETITISGGSVRHRVINAVDNNGTKVYRTSLELEDGQYIKPTAFITSKETYGTHDIISDGDMRIYLYLPESETDKSTADFKIDSYIQNYYGTTMTSGNGWLKKAYKLKIGGIETPYVNACFYRAVSGGDMDGRVEFDVYGDVYIIDDNGNKKKSLFMDLRNNKVKLYGNSRTTFTLKASVYLHSNVYWDGYVSKTERIQRELANVDVIETPDKVYDGTPIEQPGVNTNSDGKLTYHYSKYISEYDIFTEPVDGLPTEVGKYKVWVSVSKTDLYDSGASQDLDFYITKRPVTLSLTAKENGVGATVNIKVSGIIPATTNYGKVKLEYVDYLDQPQSVVVPVNKNPDGTYSAIADFPSVVSGEHTITATYIEHDANYICTPVTQTFDKSKSYREIVFGDIGEKYYGDAAFVLPVSPESGTSTSGDTWTYSIVDYYNDMPEAVSIATDGTVTIENAGVAIIKVELKDTTDVYAPAVAYISINVKPKEVTVTSYAYAAGDISKTPITSVKYGELASVEYGMNFTSINSTDIDNYQRSIVTLKTVPLMDSSEVGTHKIEINKVARENSTYVVDPFMSRNYKVTYVSGTLEVTRATLTIDVDDVIINYGDDIEYTYSCSGLKEWDTAENVFTSGNEPIISVDTSVTYGKVLQELAPGSYENVLKATGVGSTDNYNIVYGTKGNLTIKKRNIEACIEVDNKVYDKAPVELSTHLDGIIDYKEYDGKLIYTYYEITEEGLEKLDKAPVDAGHYAVEVNARDSEYYTSALCRKLYRILKATPETETPKVSNIPMKEGLKLSEQILPTGWSWVTPDADLEVGNVTAIATYTPSDTRNYNTVTASISFNVYDKNADMDSEEDNDTDIDDAEEDRSDEGEPRDEEGDNDGDSPQTEDTVNVIWFIVIMFISAIATVYQFRKKTM